MLSLDLSIQLLQVLLLFFIPAVDSVELKACTKQKRLRKLCCTQGKKFSTNYLLQSQKLNTASQQGFSKDE